MREVISEKRARQGGLGQRVLLILLASLALVCIAWFGAELFGEAISDNPPPGQIAEPQPTTQP